MSKEISKKTILLSMRMQGILDMLLRETQKQGMLSGVLDIGCDHAFVSIACIQKMIAKHVVAMDVREGPLKIAESNIRMYGLEDCVETRLSDGFECAKVGEADWAVIAGMGGMLMCNILQRGQAFLDAGIGLVLQPQSEPEVVREYLASKNYKIIDESFLQEDGKYYTIIKAIKVQECVHLEKTEAIWGPIVLQRMTPLFVHYLEEEQAKKQELLHTLLEKNTKSAMERCEVLKQEIAMLSEVRRGRHDL